LQLRRRTRYVYGVDTITGNAAQSCCTFRRNATILPAATNPAPYVLDETEDFAVVFKPPRMHCAPARSGNGDTLLDWYAAVFPPVAGLRGRKTGEGGLLHRLDFETNGLVLFAKNQKSLDFLLEQQAQGNFVKEYTAICRKPERGKTPPLTSGFPPPCFSWHDVLTPGSFVIESFFRPFGPGRKQVRPVANTAVDDCRSKTAKDRSGLYRTEITGVSARNLCGGGSGDGLRFTVRLRRGFRHQVRCHLAWIGCPILNDPLYGEETARGFLALCADGLFFDDPGTGRRREYRPLDTAAREDA